jgi:hypothetical protein
MFILISLFGSLSPLSRPFATHLLPSIYIYAPDSVFHQFLFFLFLWGVKILNFLDSYMASLWTLLKQTTLDSKKIEQIVEVMMKAL